MWGQSWEGWWSGAWSARLRRWHFHTSVSSYTSGEEGVNIHWCHYLMNVSLPRGNGSPRREGGLCLVLLAGVPPPPGEVWGMEQALISVH